MLVLFDSLPQRLPEHSVRLSDEHLSRLPDKEELLSMGFA